jgi:guanylate kinase
VSEEEFNRMQENGELVSNVHIENGMLNYNNGTSYADLEKEGNLILDMNPEGIEHLDAVAKEKNWQLFKIYLHANIYDREDRMVERNLKSVPLENRTDTHYMISDIAVWQRMKKDTNPQTPYSEKDADLVIENKDFNEAYSAIKEGVRGFLSRREYDERAMELRRK